MTLSLDKKDIGMCAFWYIIINGKLQTRILIMKKKNIWSYLFMNKKETILAPVFKMLEATFELIIPLIVADIIDKGIAGGDTSYIVLRGLLMMAFGLIGFSFTIVAQYFSAKSAIGVSSALRQDLFYHINELNYKELDKTGTSALITGMTSDINQVQNGINWVLRLLLRSPFIVIGAAIMASFISVKASVIFWITIAVLIFIVFLIMSITTPMNVRVQKQLETVTKSFRENLLGVRVVRAFNRQDQEQAEFAKRHDELYARQVRAGRISALFNPLTFAGINFAIVVILYCGSFQVNTGALSQGEVIALINYMSQILVEIIKFANVIIMLSKAIASYKRIMNIIAIEPSLQNGSRAFNKERAADIKLENVSFSYNDDSGNAVDNVSCHIPPGTHVGIIGATGSGKSTLIDLICRFYERTSGRILINDIPIEEYDTASLTDGIAVVPQKAVLFKGTLRSNLKWGNRETTDEQCYDALKDSCAIDFVKEKGDGLELAVSQNGKNFSGGQKQRLTIARALIKKCALLILDDSYSALDFATESHIKSSVFTNKENCTVLTVSQRVSSIHASDMILVLDNGRLAGMGTHEELMTSCPVYTEICQSQHFKQEAAV